MQSCYTIMHHLVVGLCKEAPLGDYQVQLASSQTDRHTPCPRAEGLSRVHAQLHFLALHKRAGPNV